MNITENYFTNNSMNHESVLAIVKTYQDKSTQTDDMMHINTVIEKIVNINNMISTWMEPNCRAYQILCDKLEEYHQKNLLSTELLCRQNLSSCKIASDTTNSIQLKSEIQEPSHSFSNQSESTSISNVSSNNIKLEDISNTKENKKQRDIEKESNDSILQKWNRFGGSSEQEFIMKYKMLRQKKLFGFTPMLSREFLHQGSKDDSFIWNKK